MFKAWSTRFPVLMLPQWGPALQGLHGIEREVPTCIVAEGGRGGRAHCGRYLVRYWLIDSLGEERSLPSKDGAEEVGHLLPTIRVATACIAVATIHVECILLHMNM